jgi:phosphoribosyl-AMP cyclohydrolase
MKAEAEKLLWNRKAELRVKRIMQATMQNPDQLIAALCFNEAGLIPAIAQQHDTGEVLMLAWMTADSLRETLASGQVTYWSRSRGELWRKGATSGHTQKLIELRYDCDADALLLLVEQTGAACHTGERSCFYRCVCPEM